MSGSQLENNCAQAEQVCVYALHALPASDAAAVEAHIASCPQCTRELHALRAVVDSFSGWPEDVLRPAPSLQQQLARRISEETGMNVMPPAARSWSEPEWEEVAPGISCKLLANDEHRHRVSMLVRLAPGAAYPPHTHAGVEELHLLHGELWIEDRKLFPGDYNRAEAGTGDTRVWSETGCTCVLITSTKDLLR